MECSLLLYFVGFDFTVIMLLYASGYTLCLKRTKSSCKVWKDKMLPFMAAEKWKKWQEGKYFYCALMNLGFVFYGCLYLWEFVMYFEGDYWKACALWGLKWCTMHISQYLVLVLCETGLTCAQGNTTCCKTVKSKSQKTCSGWRSLISCCQDETWLANVLCVWIERDWLGLHKKADVGF